MYKVTLMPVLATIVAVEKQLRITYSECVFVTLVGKQGACAILSPVTSPAVPYFSTLPHKRHDFRGEKY
jgi:hypothetical protein